VIAGVITVSSALAPIEASARASIVLALIVIVAAPTARQHDRCRAQHRSGQDAASAEPFVLAVARARFHTRFRRIPFHHESVSPAARRTHLYPMTGHSEDRSQGFPTHRLFGYCSP